MLSTRRIWCVGLILALCNSLVPAITISKDGQAQAVIVTAPEASEPEQHAAQELARFLGQVTGAEFKMATSEDEQASCIFVGPTAAKWADEQFSTDGLGAEGIVLKTVGDDLILAGGRPRGTLYAVYTFLEDQLGCRWWSSTESTIPKKPTIAVDRLDVRYVPPLEYRSPFWFDAFDGDWSARNKANGQAHRLEARHGGKHIYEGFVHTFFPLIPPAEVFRGPSGVVQRDRGQTQARARAALPHE